MGRWEWFCPVTGEKLARTFSAGEEVALGLSAEGAEQLGKQLGYAAEEVQRRYADFQKLFGRRDLEGFLEAEK